jgi:hypothetical protein
MLCSEGFCVGSSVALSLSSVVIVSEDPVE